MLGIVFESSISLPLVIGRVIQIFGCSMIYEVAI